LGLDGPPPAASPTLLRRFAGGEADELAILCRPASRSASLARQADASYRSLAQALAGSGASFQHLASETLFLRDIRRDLPRVLEVRARVVAELGQGATAPLPGFIQQAPLDLDAGFLVSASAVIPHRPEAWSVHDVRAVPSCDCEGCAQSGARLVHLGKQVSLHSTNVYGTGDDACAEVLDMFRAAERLLQQCGMGFADVTRTWIHMRDIDRDYDALNRARRQFFNDRGIELRPASTGVQGVPLPENHDFSLTVQAIQSPQPLGIRRMSTPTLNEAWSYGADFSRGLRLREANKVTLSISGTASLDEAGRSVHVGDFEAQADRMLENIEALLAQQGASFDDLVSGVTYLKNPDDAQVLRSIYHERGFDNFPCAIVEAPLCRPELLCETEAVAFLRRDRAGE
jgi:enamine deaminase RidA (YjgF/YER057c/UK114 family)